MMASSWRLHQLVLCCAMAVAMLSPAEGGRASVRMGNAAPETQPKPKPGPEEQFLAGQNQARAAVGVGPLRWSVRLCNNSSRLVREQRERNGCDFADLSASPYGANQKWTSYPVSPAEVVRSWVEEGRFYSYANNSCATGHECGTYTQVVWRRTAEIGCGQAICGRGGATLTLCLYYPHGNVQGQKPY